LRDRRRGRGSPRGRNVMKLAMVMMPVVIEDTWDDEDEETL
jgi:hypothetical protein